MELDTKGNSEIIKPMVWDDSSTIMVISMRENLEMIKQMVKVHINIVQGHSTLDAGEMIRKTAMEEKIGMMGLTMRGISKVA